MKSPIDEQPVTFEMPATRETFRAEKPKPPGGKVLLRMALFAAERGISVRPDGIEGAPSKKPRRAATRESSEDAGGEVSSDAAPVAEIYAATARDLASGSRSEIMAAAPAPAPAPAAPIVPPPPSWRPLGPIYMPNGQTYGASRVDVAGRIAALAVNPTNRDHLLVGSAAGGIWQSADRGVTWIPRSDFSPTLMIGAIAYTPSNPSIVYAGTGEGNAFWWFGAGLLRSTNGGTTWSVLTAAPFVGKGFYDLIVDPANANHLLAATTHGLYESANAGVNWTQRRAAQSWDLSMHPAGGAASEVLAACADGLFRSTNGGTTWTAVTLPGAAGSWNRLAVAHSRSNPAVAYAFGSQGGAGKLFRRNAAGTWQSVTAPTTLNVNQDWYDWFLAVAPDTENRIYIGTIDVFRGELTGTTAAWTNISSKPSGDSIHPDQHAIMFDPTDPNTVYIGNDGGLYRSTNRGVNWQALNRGLAITELEYMAQDVGTSQWILSGTQDNGSIRYTGSNVWEHVADGDGGDCTVNRANPNTVFHSYYSMGMERSTTKGGWGSFSWIGPNVPAGYQALFYPPMESCNDVIAQAGQSVWLSRNNGTNWTEKTLPAGCIASAMYMPTINRVFVGCTDGRIFRLDWSGAAWSAPVALTTPRSGAQVSDLFISPNDLNRIWATYTNLGGGRIFRSDNGGTNWTNCSAGLPALPMNAVEVDPGNPNRVWVAADLGVFQSFDAGATWASLSLGLPNVLVGDLIFHPHARVLRAGTRNRGAWEIPVDGWLVEPIVGVQFTGTLAANAQQKWFTFNWPATWHVIWTVMPTTVQPGGAQVSWKVEVERASAEFVTYWISVKNLKPNPVTFEGRYAILSRY